MPNFLFEMLLEEVPQNVLPEMALYIESSLPELLNKYKLSYHNIRYFASPRRVGFLINGLPLEAENRIIEQKGPSIKAAYDSEGKPTKALEGFLATYHVAISDIEEREIKGQKYIFIRKTEQGLGLEHLFPQILKELIDNIRFNQPMRWNCNGNLYEFIRPVRGITVLIDEKVLPVSFFGIDADRKLFGHRQLFPNPVELKTATEYEEVLEQNGCIPNFEKRRQIIFSAVNNIADTKKAELLLDNELLNTLTSLTEYPYPVLGEYESSFLSLPKEVLISEMKVHQKYIPLADNKGTLIPNYIITANLPSDDPETKANILAGNHRVLCSRFTDGAFFFEEDIRKGLTYYAEVLKDVSFVEGAGSMADKVQRMHKLAEYFADNIFSGINKAQLTTVVSLAKADLNSLMVGEFPELQGIMGYYYALKEGVDPAVALAVKEHYYPMSIDGVYTSPSQALSAVAGLADRFDNLFTLYAVGKTVTGSRDPYALRRQMIASIHLLLQFECSQFSLNKLLEFALPIYQPFMTVTPEEWKAQIYRLISVRLEGILKSEPYHYQIDTITAVFAHHVDMVLDDIKRVGVLSGIRLQNKDQFVRLVELAKRIGNIIKDQPEYSLDESMLIDQAEKNLYLSYTDLSKSVSELPYDVFLTKLLEMESVIALFFDSVMVKTGDQLQYNRTALLQNLYRLFLMAADFSKFS
ncbi:MAG: glycine--tRNA ligase subunit beta [Brevinemataceae bacterium]